MSKKFTLTFLEFTNENVQSEEDYGKNLHGAGIISDQQYVRSIVSKLELTLGAKFTEVTDVHGEGYWKEWDGSTFDNTGGETFESFYYELAGQFSIPNYEPVSLYLNILIGSQSGRVLFTFVAYEDFMLSYPAENGNVDMIISDYEVSTFYPIENLTKQSFEEFKKSVPVQVSKYYSGDD